MKKRSQYCKLATPSAAFAFWGRVDFIRDDVTMSYPSEPFFISFPRNFIDKISPVWWDTRTVFSCSSHPRKRFQQSFQSLRYGADH
jgi:hypothetical protein